MRGAGPVSPSVVTEGDVLEVFFPSATSSGSDGPAAMSQKSLHFSIPVETQQPYS